jgi:hypothetical protein
VRAGLVAGAASAGALIGLGVRHGAALDPFVFAGQALLRGAPVPTAAAIGVALHLGWMVVWGVCFSAVAATLRGVRLAVVAVVATVLLVKLSQLVVPSLAPLTGPAATSRAHAVFMHVLLAASLVVGMRLARRPHRVT